MAIRFPLSFRISSLPSFKRSRPSKNIYPEMMRPGWGINRIRLSAVTLFPHPDSPTSPSTLPLSILKLTSSTARRVAGKKLSLIPILRAGLGMVEGISQLIPSARVGHVGLFRDHETLQPVSYYFKVPAAETDRDFFVLDPMLATGGSAGAAVTQLLASRASRVR